MATQSPGEAWGLIFYVWTWHQNSQDQQATNIEDKFLRNFLLSCWLLAAGQNSPAFHSAGQLPYVGKEQFSLEPSKTKCTEVISLLQHVVILEPNLRTEDTEMRNKMKSTPRLKRKYASSEYQIFASFLLGIKSLLHSFWISNLCFIPLPFLPSTEVHIYQKVVPDQPGFSLFPCNECLWTPGQALSVLHSIVGPCKGLKSRAQIIHITSSKILCKYSLHLYSWNKTFCIL